MKKLLAAGVPVGAGTDMSRVSSYNPWLCLEWLVTGKGVGGTQLLGPNTKLDRETALRLWTDNAWFSSEENLKGRLAPGLLADLAVLSEDYFSVPEDRIRDLESVLMLAGGPELYGVLLGCVGAGAVTGALILPKIKSRLDANRIVAAGTAGTALALTIFAAIPDAAAAGLASTLAGASWIAVLSSLHVSAQTALPDWVRARAFGLSDGFLRLDGLGKRDLGAGRVADRHRRRPSHRGGGGSRRDPADLAVQAGAG